MTPAAWRLIRTAVTAGGWQVRIDRDYPPEIDIYLERGPWQYRRGHTHRMGAVWRIDAKGQWRFDHGWIRDHRLSRDVPALLRDLIAVAASGGEPS